VVSVSSGVDSWTDYRASARLRWYCGCTWIVKFAQGAPTVTRIGSSVTIPKDPAYMTEYVYIYMNIYKYTCSQVDGTMYTMGLCTYIYIYTYQHCICVNVYMYICICSNGKCFVLQESLEPKC